MNKDLATTITRNRNLLLLIFFISLSDILGSGALKLPRCKNTTVNTALQKTPFLVV
jgi:hypothetical protein